MAVFNEVSKGGLICGGSYMSPPPNDSLWLFESKEDQEAYERFARAWQHAVDSSDDLVAPIFTALATYNETATGGVLGGGDAIGGIGEIGDGGVEGGGNAVISAIYNIIASGGAEGGAEGDIGSFDETGEGGVVAGGAAAQLYEEVASGGVEAGGDSISQVTYLATGGVLGGGDAIGGIGEIGDGGVDGGGDLVVTSNVTNTGSGGAEAGGNGEDTLFKNTTFENNDPTKRRVVVGGQATAKFAVSYIASGGFTVGGSSDQNFVWELDTTFLWRLNAIIKKDLTFFWNTGNLPIFWYRIIGKAKQGNVCGPINTPSEPCCQRMILNVHARTPAELCQKLSKRNFIWPIDRVEKFSIPADNELSSGENCNELIPVEICEVPACAEFCVDYDLRVEIGGSDFVQVNAFFEQEVEGTLFIGGVAGVTLFRDVPNYEYEADGGIIIGGTVDYVSSGYGPVGSGGITIGGTAKQISSAYSYVGGEWPLTTGAGGGDESESLEEEITDVPWGAIDRVLVNNALPTQVDLSFGKTSEHLIVRGFDFSIPDAANILGIIVRVIRSASVSGVRDVSAYLLVGDEIVSDNLAETSVDWPLIHTSKDYGTRGLEGDTGLQWVGEESDLPELSPEDINDEEFGFSLRLNSTTVVASTFAYITYIEAQVYYEDQGDIHILRSGGEAKIVSSAFSYVGSGEIEVGGPSLVKVGRHYLPTGISPTLTSAFVMGGSYGRHYDYVPDLCLLMDRATAGVRAGGVALVTPVIYVADTTKSGVRAGGVSTVSSVISEKAAGVVAGGTAHLNPLPVTASGGAAAGGAALVKPYQEIGSGGVVGGGGIPQPLTLSGSALARPSWQLIEASGGAVAGGAAKVTPYMEFGSGGAVGGAVLDVNSSTSYTYEASGEIEVSGIGSPLGEQVYEASGEVEIGGEADYKSSSYHFSSDSGPIFVLGGADIKNSDLGTLETNIGVQFTITELNFEFGDDTIVQAIDVPITTVNRCACPDMPLVVQMSHNLSRNNEFAQFLVRNSFAISRIQDMKYNAGNDSWQNNLHFRGVSAKRGNLEDWNLVFDLKCTTLSGGIEIGDSIWQFGVHINKEDLITGEDFDTRVLVAVIPDLLCSSGQLVFTIDYDTQLDYAVIDPNGTVYNNVLYDNIGLFKTRYWQDNPILEFQISQVGIDELTPRYDASGFGRNKPLIPV